MRHAIPCLVASLFLSACGSDSDGGDSTPPPVASLSLLAGNVGGSGSADGTGSSARFNNPRGIAIDAAGNLYVGDTWNHTIRKITPAGAVTTIAGKVQEHGITDGPVAQARLDSPANIAIDAAGNVYITDAISHLIRKLTPAGIVSTIAGRTYECGVTDGAGAAATFCSLAGIAAAPDGTLFVSDSHVIRRISPASVVSTIAGTYPLAGWADGVGPAARFRFPYGVALDAGGAVVVADGGNYAIRRVAPDGTTTTIAGVVGAPAHVDGPGATAKFMYPFGVATDTLGNIYVADAEGHTIRRIDSGGVVSTLAGTPGVRGYADGTGTAAQFNTPIALVANAAGDLFVSDTANSVIRRISPAGVVSTFAGAPSGRGYVDATGAAAKFANPNGIAVDASGNTYVADGGTGGVGSTGGVIRKISPAGVVTTLAGNPSLPGASIDGVGVNARFSEPRGLAIDGAGNLYMSDAACPSPGAPPSAGFVCSGVIRRITPDGTVTTVAGAPGVYGGTDGIGAQASFSSPEGLAFDSSGNLFVADSMRNTLRKIDRNGLVTTVAGDPAGAAGDADGTGSAARFRGPTQVVRDAGDNMYVIDSRPGRVRRVTPAGTVTTVATPQGNHRSIAIDAQGNLYLGDPSASVIRKLTNGTLTVVVGTEGQATFEPGALPGRTPPPRSLVMRGTDLYFTVGDGIALVRNVP